jgi:flagellar hook-length control protein FliK
VPAWNLLISHSNELEKTMADFMTVLAASQQQSPAGSQSNALAAPLPGSLFEHLLSTQIAATTEGEAVPLPQVQALPGEIVAQAKSAAKKLVLSADADLSASLPNAPLPDASLLATPLPAAPLPAASLPDAPLPDAPLPAASLPNALLAAASLPAESLPDALSAVAQDTVSDKPAVSAEASAKPVFPRIRPTLELAATPAASVPGAGQQLPPVDQKSPPLAGDAAASSAVAETLLAKVAVAVPTPGNQDHVQTDPVAVRQLGHFEQLARTSETRVQAAIEAPVRSQGFPADFSEKIVWLAGRQSQVANLSLNPPQLGSLEVHLSLSGNDAGAQFYSPHPMVRDAIEAALPKLRELMAQAGIALGDTQVRDQAFAQRDSGGSPHMNDEAASGAMTIPLAPVAAGASRAGLGLVDLYV